MADDASTIDHLLLEVARTAGQLSAPQLDQALEHIARAGFDPGAQETVRGRLAGVTWRGRTLRGTDRLPPAEAHYLWHVVVQQEWPVGTTLNQYIDSVAQVMLDARSGIFTNRYLGAWQVGAVRQSFELRGPVGHEWVLIEYRIARGYWTTAYQPGRGLGELQSPQREDVQWLRHPEMPIA